MALREISFRGKRLDNGEWVEGGYFFHYGECRIVAEGTVSDYIIHYPVDPATVGQYTGLRDKQGKQIFEGDVVSTGKEKRVVRFRNGAFELLRRVSAVAMYDLVGTDVEYEVIGNIHDNPELLEVTPDE